MMQFNYNLKVRVEKKKQPMKRAMKAMKKKKAKSRRFGFGFGLWGGFDPFDDLSPIGKREPEKVLLNYKTTRAIQWTYPQIQKAEIFGEKSVLMAFSKAGECLQAPKATEISSSLKKMDKPFVKDLMEVVLEFGSRAAADEFLKALEEKKSDLKEERAEKNAEKKAKIDAGIVPMKRRKAGPVQTVAGKELIESVKSDGIQSANPPGEYAQKSIEKWNLRGPYKPCSESAWQRYYGQRVSDETRGLGGRSSAFLERARLDFGKCLVSSGQVSKVDAAHAAKGLFLRIG